MRTVLRLMLIPVLAAASLAAFAEPVGYSVNSDAPDGDSLHRIDLATGTATSVSGEKVLSTTGFRTDIEGLAFDLAGNLWAIDEDSFRLFQISTVSGYARSEGDVMLSGISSRLKNDFGMTFTCDEDDPIFISSVSSQTLYRLGLDGVASVVGSEGALGQNISALAAWGNPTRLYGLGNGLGMDDAPDSRSLFSIDTETGQATLVGELGAAAGAYYEAGLSFDADGNLWALTDRGSEPSQILQVNTENGAATLISTASGLGFESLAVASPSGCNLSPSSEFNHKAIPTLDRIGQLLALLALLSTGLVALSRRPG